VAGEKVVQEGKGYALRESVPSVPTVPNETPGTPGTGQSGVSDCPSPTPPLGGGTGQDTRDPQWAVSDDVESEQRSPDPVPARTYAA
jgi:hypothetical protein